MGCLLIYKKNVYLHVFFKRINAVEFRLKGILKNPMCYNLTIIPTPNFSAFLFHKNHSAKVMLSCCFKGSMKKHWQKRTVWLHALFAQKSTNQPNLSQSDEKP